MNLFEATELGIVVKLESEIAALGDTIQILFSPSLRGQDWFPELQPHEAPPSAAGTERAGPN